MCEKGFFSIKSVSNLSSKYAFVPCGQCPSCRNVKRNSWVFRLRVEFEELVKKGWQVGFRYGYRLLRRASQGRCG